ncbi:MAG: hypothetical protein ACREUU_18755, partial [Gammaproteobacteria bacterium]
DAVEFMMAGASAVQIGTATFLNPSAPLEIIEGIEEFMRREHVEDIGEILGAALPTREDPEATGVQPDGLRTRA